MFRQNASWQGSIRWIEGEREESFRSALEMVFLIDSVVDKAEKEKTSEKMRDFQQNVTEFETAGIYNKTKISGSPSQGPLTYAIYFAYSIKNL